MKKSTILSASLLLILASACSEEQVQQSGVRNKATFTVGDITNMDSRSVMHDERWRD